MKKLLLSLLLVSVNGVIYSQWTSQSTGFSAVSRGVDDIEIVNASTVWAKAYDGTAAAANVQEFTRTINGGTTWIPGIIDIGDTTLQITNISAISGTTAWAGAVDATNGGGGVWKTTDGGVTWNKQNPSGYLSSTSFFNVVHFFDANNGITEGDPVGVEFEVYLTNNGGTTWTPVVAANIPNMASGEWGYNGGNVAAGNSFWFVTNKGKLYRTTDMGVTWTKLSTPISDFGTTAINGKVHFSDNNNGVLLGTIDSGTTYKLYTTANGGTTWSAGVAYTQPYKNITYVPGTLTLVGTGSTGAGASTVYSTGYSNDNGVTWTNIDSGTQRGGISFINGTTGWASGFTTSPTVGGIYKYTGAALSTTNFDKKQITATPNPTNGTIQLTGATINEVAVFDIVGKQVFNSKFSAVNDLSLDLSSLQAGAYILKATNDTGATQTIKIMKN